MLGVNESGYESGNASFCEGRDLPWLQDTPSVDLWRAWSVTYRDVIVLDRDGAAFGVYNLSDNDLSDPENLAALEELLLSVP